MKRDPAPMLEPASPTGVARRPWPMYAKASLVCHAGAGIAALALPSAWPWAAGAVLANHLLLTGAGLWPRSTWLGRNWTRLPAVAAARGEIAITVDDGPDAEVTPAVLDLLDAHGVRATFFVIAMAAARAPALCREIVRRGHSVQNHSDRHAHTFSLLGPGAMAREIGAAQARLCDITGTAPRFFRAPAGLRNPFLAPVLERLELELVSWTRRGFDTVRSDPAQVLSRLARGLAAGDILLLHDGNAARTAAGRPVILEVLPRLVERCVAAGLRATTLPVAFDTTADAARRPAAA
jgi:peptidoglycan/xylan/chitin deacetylase (PgdA/CDA1 family)